MSAYRPFSYGKFGRVPDLPERGEICGKCKYHVHEDIDDGWVCVNPDSECFTEWTEYDDSCMDFEERE